MRMRPRDFRSLFSTLVSSYEFPQTIPGTPVFDPNALNNWFARQSGMVAGGNAATTEDGGDPFLQRERSRIEKAALHTSRPEA